MDLYNYVAHLKLGGVSDQEIRKQLLERGIDEGLTNSLIDTFTLSKEERQEILGKRSFWPGVLCSLGGIMAAIPAYLYGNFYLSLVAWGTLVAGIMQIIYELHQKSL